jgi:hypothetical protein
METNQTAPRRQARRPFGESPFSALWLTAVAPVAISLLSLALSLYTIVEASREPQIWLSAPDVVRVAAGERAWFYVQPRLVSAAANDRVAVISGLRLEVVGPEGGAPTTFIWDEQGTWQYDTVSRGLTWIYQADAAPLVVGPSSPQLPICLFEGPDGWTWQAGTYQVAIVASRGQDAEAMEAAFTVTLPEETVEMITSQPRTWVEVRTEIGSASA